MANTIVKYVASGTTKEFSVPFQYIGKADVEVLVDSVAVSFNWVNSGTIILAALPSSNQVVTIKRQTSKVPLVDFTDGSTLFEADLDLANKQARYLAEEAVDRAEQSLSLNDSGVWDAQGRRLTNIAEPISDDEVATKGFVTSASSSTLAQAIEVRDQLYNLTTSMNRLPYGTDGYVEYNATTGLLEVFLSEGPQGPLGPTGPTGPNGPAGPQGSEGPRGPQGPIGATGGLGPQGQQGLQGPTGLQGVKGDQGDRGPEGVRGNSGETGAQGPQGVQGLIGPTGAEGPRGIQGVIGPVGPLGPQGIQGVQGEIGPIGPQGIQGPLGPDGDKGPQGDMGATPLGLAFGRFYMNEEGELMIEYYGDATDNDFRIDAEGYLYVQTV